MHVDLKAHLSSSISQFAGFLILFLATSLLPMNGLRAQVPPAPICPSAQNVGFVAVPPGSLQPITSTRTVAIGIRRGIWDFYAQSIDVVGFTITLDAPSLGTGIYMLPIQYVPMGVLPAGTYSVTINPIANNVVPSVACPAVTVQLVVLQAFENVPVPVAGGAWAALLALLAGLVGLAWMSRRRSGC